ncbi:MAG TPA: rhomboid family intramembrane serine protease [Rhizomicrobium sp.]|nr:rhomboid family intramembrane serine protease [Rhizomicrobium sp.]
MTFLQDPQSPHQPMIRAPFVVLVLIAVLVVAYILWSFAPLQFADRILYDFALWPIRYSHAYLAAHGAAAQSPFALAIPFISYAFLHGSIGHIAINSIWLLVAGPLIARRWGAGLFLVTFFVCAIAAALAHLATNWGASDPVIGASGAISGLMGAGIRMLWGRVWIEGEPFPRLAPLLSKQVIVFSLFWVFGNALAGYTGLGTGEAAGLVAWQAHIGGFFAGLFLATPFDAFARRRLLNP